MRIAYVEASLEGLSQADLAVANRIRARRAPSPLQALDLTLLHSPTVANGWNSFLGSIRNETTLPAAIREILICRVAVINGARYEWDDHAPLAIQAGLSIEAMDLLKRRDLENVDRAQRVRAGLADKDWAALLLADEMTQNVKVRRETFSELQKHFGERELVEIIATISCYNCVSRFIVALDIGEKNDEGFDVSQDCFAADSPQTACY
ncbi:hypothetical protein ONS95_005364 [Cadophora gregata]|uniref:uncharacterized protein n=1 Tax=Cadophora gregata TaxID=51156 RepID=UPI0026DB33E9|nr:uncharacterized protein ONS95_005364 [Cadophora gregata]KAK0103338.1 hypothetical protein ONS95_005364 [Cadophora gregata]KAK0107527.1 hypothetical protein ONS96_003334 [Cadophora gregata f. sp. sojae]